MDNKQIRHGRILTLHKIYRKTGSIDIVKIKARSWGLSEPTIKSYLNEIFARENIMKK